MVGPPAVYVLRRRNPFKHQTNTSRIIQDSAIPNSIREILKDPFPLDLKENHWTLCGLVGTQLFSSWPMSKGSPRRLGQGLTGGDCRHHPTLNVYLIPLNKVLTLSFTPLEIYEIYTRPVSIIIFILIIKHILIKYQKLLPSCLPEGGKAPSGRPSTCFHRHSLPPCLAGIQTNQ